MCSGLLGLAENDFAVFDTAAFRQWTGPYEALERALLNRLGLPYYRIMTTPPAAAVASNGPQGRRGHRCKRDAQRYVPARDESSPSQIQWGDAFLLWGTLMPDRDNVDVGRIRDLAIFLRLWISAPAHDGATPSFVREFTIFLVRL